MKKRSQTSWKRNIIKCCVTFVLAFVMITGLMPESLAGALHLTQTTQAATTLSNPRIVADSSMQAGQKVTWDCVWFGSYPQTEIVDQASTCGTYGRSFGTAGDYEVDKSLYNTLANATGWDSNGDITISGIKYRRIKIRDYTAEFSGGEDNPGHYKLDSDDHYFRYEPIKWRVLDVSGSKAFLLADKALDVQKYNDVRTEITWENSTIRSWLNNYGSSFNTCGNDYSSKGFKKTAFSSSEQDAIIETEIENKNNIQHSTAGGSNTTDKIFLLSESEVYDTDEASNYGFVKNYETQDEARRAKSSTYAKAMETWTDSNGNCWWLLRSPG